MAKKKTSLAAYPYFAWSALFIVIPLLIVLFFSFTVQTDSGYSFSLENYSRLISSQYFNIFLRSIWLALISTILCLIVGYPVAYIISQMKVSRRNFMIMLFILPMWMNFLLRTYAWMPILGKTGIVNNILSKVGIGPISFLYNDGAVLLGMVYNFLPFMVLPLYTILIKMDQDLINAAADLGANRFKIFLKVILPLSIPGIFSGITMVFMPAVSTFVISRLLGGGQFMLLGNLIEQQYTTMGDWNFGSAISIFMMIIILIFMALTSKFDSGSDKEGGTQLW
ncbi:MULTISPECIES: ABC transporter permease [Clostridium]|jgi:spermidine/putrescine transport system permease protein|uniref:Putrescine transport system permease protein PotH n=2 Tax=Clostridium butyricum TaxID=1492 RepID=C4IH56_CLOBU|nr:MULTISPECIES: ABC transporter permease [Clostridium]ETI88445.1 MAG: Putrescine transport system permease protein PotH [Clostridium butyricum DORA_1]APF21877.1 binding--dependent transport system inner membrane component family protein [Clostridium butyricum]AXB84039.1 ABC transporter permease [Clostridium butyricum]EDT75080.1 putrescine transport system permease protein PotH [Clostridium butyricum 5521]EEP53424.1 putrescine transport system permease protein PotH [Clostridium butyricum E4 st